MGEVDMSAIYQLVNATKRETLKYLHLPVSKAREIAINPVTAAMTAWYMLKHQGDVIGFVSEYDLKWPLATGSWEELKSYKEVTEEVITSIVEAEIAKDLGVSYVDDTKQLILREIKII
jgi:hypothetical protein